MIWQIVHGCDFEKARIPLFARSPYLEIEALATDQQVSIKHWISDELGCGANWKKLPQIISNKVFVVFFKSGLAFLGEL
jgi:hypothetical protein